MSGKHRLTKSFKGLDVTKQDKRKRIRGILGNVIGGNQVVEVTTRPGYVWVRLRDQQSEIIQAFNDSVSPVYDLPVFVTRDSNDPTRYVIDSRDTAQYQNWGAGAAYLPRHANQHSFSDDAGAAGDVVWVYGRQFMPLLAYPSGSNGANNVIISPYTYFAQSQNWVYSGNTGTASIVAYKPTGSNARVVLVYMDVNGNPQLLPGDYFAATITGTSQIVQYLPDLPNNTKPIAAIRLVSGTAIINWNNIYDIRQFYNDSVVAPTSTPSLGIAVYEDHVYKATGTVLDFTDNMNVAVTGSSIFISSTGGGGGGGTGTTLGARVYRTLDQNIPNGLTGTAIIWTNEEYDDDNIHSGSSTKLVCNTAGTYLIVGNVEWTPNSSGERQLFIRLNGQNITGILGIVIDQNGGATAGQIQNVSTIWDLNVGDYVELCAAHNSTTTPLAIVGEVAATEFPTFMMQRFGDAGSTIINTGTVVINNTYNTYNTSNELAIFDDGIFKVTGSAISFDSNLSVAVTGSVAFVSSTATGGGGDGTGSHTHVWQEDHSSECNNILTDFISNQFFVPTTTHIFLNGLLQRIGASYDYTEGFDNQTISFNTAPLTGDALIFAYIVGTGTAALSGPYLDQYGNLSLRSIGNYHGHTTDSDGAYTAAQFVGIYSGSFYGNLAITDHDLVTTQPTGISIPIAGNECTPVGNHVLSLNSIYTRGAETSVQTIINGITASGGFSVLSHPDFSAGYTTGTLATLTGYLGIEIHNAYVEAATTTPQLYPGFSLNKWDYVLTNVRRNVWGFANDDFHDMSYKWGYDIGRNIIFSTGTSKSDIIASIQNGNFVADVSNFGIWAGKPVVSRNDVSLTCSGTTWIRFIGDGGTLLQQTSGTTATYNFLGTENYVRIEAVGSYTEPFSSAIDTSNRWGVDSGSWNSSSGTLTQHTSAAGPYIIWLKRHRYGDFECSYKIRIAASGGSNRQAGLLFNALNSTNMYYLSIEPPATTGDFILWKYNNSATPTEIDRDAAAALSDATWYNVKMIYTFATGNIKAKVWAVGDGEPGTWNIDVNDTTIKHGAFGFRTRYPADFDDLYIDGFKTYYQPIPTGDWL